MGIAALFNKEGVPPPRAHTKHRRKGWVASTIREILRNEAYIGVWRFKRKQWRKIPETPIRRYRLRPEPDVMTRQRPHLRIIDQDFGTRLPLVGARLPPSTRARTRGPHPVGVRPTRSLACSSAPRAVPR
jgi:hypothetical protein